MALRPTTPPLNSLRAFEAAARLGSMKLAAQELSVTPGAVSQQVANLERILGIPLFDRQGARLALTPAGRAYHPVLRGALDDIEAATVDLVTHGGEHSRLVIGTLHTFSANWLIPRLDSFCARHPTIRPVVETLSLNFATPERTPDVARRRIDVGIYYGDGQWPDMVTRKIFEETMVVVAKPGLVPSSLHGDPVAIVTKYPRLIHTTRPRAWDDWVQDNQLAITALPPELVGAGFEHLFMVIEAARIGLGVAVLPRQLLGRMLDEGALEIVTSTSAPSVGSYHLFHSETRADDPDVRAFVDWALDQAAEPTAP